MEIKEERLPEELVKSNIPLMLNGYNDIFSDFDPRPFNERALSDDFLLECKHAAREKEEGLELILAVPRAKRNLSDEIKIKKRLKDHFKKHHLEEEKEVKSIKREGIIWVSLGILILIGVVYGLANPLSTFTEALLTVMEVPSWFLVWEGMRKIMIDSKEKAPEATFYHKMASADIHFKSY
jgi:hypothetical protein